MLTDASVIVEAAAVDWSWLIEVGWLKFVDWSLLIVDIVVIVVVVATTEVVVV